MKKACLPLLLIVLCVYFSLGLKAQDRPGVYAEFYDLEDQNLELMPYISEGQRPTIVKEYPRPVLADYLQNMSFLTKGKAWMVRIKGQIQSDKRKYYYFMVKSYGFRMYVNGKLVADESKTQSFYDKKVSAELKEGKNDILLEGYFVNTTNYKELTLWWKAGKEMEYVPEEVFSYKGALPATGTGKVKVEKNKMVISRLDTEPLNAVHPSFDLITLRPEWFKPRVAAMDFYDNGNMVLTTWDSAGGVYLIKNLHTNDTSKIQIKRIAAGVAEPLGVKVVDGRLYVLQKQELTELIDNDGDELIDEYRTVCNGWGVTSNFHEFAFGLLYKQGYFYAALATAIQPGGASTIPQNPERGKAIKIDANTGAYEIIAKGLRTPNGIGWGVDNELFITDNQGSWLPSCKLMHITPGSFHGNYSVEINDAGKFIEKPPVAWLPQGEIGNSPGNPTTINVGPYLGQMIHGDVTYGGIQRVFVEKIKGEYQGCVFKFTQGLEAGVNRIAWGPDGDLYVGGIGVSGNWGQFAKLEYGFQKLHYNGKAVFEPLAVRAKTNGFELEFTLPLADTSGNKPEDYEISHWKYVPTRGYGGPKVDLQDLLPTAVHVSADRKKVFLEIKGIEEGRVVYFHLNPAMRSRCNNELWTTQGWYTLNHIPESDSGFVVKAPLAAAPVVKKVTSTVSSTTPAASKTLPTPAMKKEQPEALAAEARKLIPYTGCTNCHAYDMKILGPAFNDVAAKYPNDEKSYNYLVKKVMEGGSGVWGDHAMSPQSHIKKSDIEKMVKYILTLDGK